VLNELVDWSIVDGKRVNDRIFDLPCRAPPSAPTRFDSILSLNYLFPSLSPAYFGIVYSKTITLAFDSAVF
jgi:hypothetical protein